MRRKDLCPSMDDWQRFVLDQGDAQRQELQDHLKICPYCQFLVEQIRAEVAESKQVWEDISSGVVRLTELVVEPVAEELVVTTLAAQGNHEPDETATLTLSSADQKLMLRAVRDRHSNEVWLYLLADDSSTCRNVLIRPFGREDEVMTDGDGRVNLGNVAWPKPENFTAEVHMPRATFKLSEARNLAEQGSSSVLESPGGDRIRVSFSGQGRNRKLTVQVLDMVSAVPNTPLKAAIRVGETGACSGVKSITLEEASFDDVSTEASLEIYFFQ